MRNAIRPIFCTVLHSVLLFIGLGPLVFLTGCSHPTPDNNQGDLEKHLGRQLSSTEKAALARLAAAQEKASNGSPLNNAEKEDLASWQKAVAETRKAHDQVESRNLLIFGIIVAGIIVLRVSYVQIFQQKNSAFAIIAGFLLLAIVGAFGFVLLALR